MLPRNGYLRQQEFHLIGKDTAITEQQIFRPGGRKRDRQEGHSSLFRGAVILTAVTPATGGYDVGPNVAPPAGEGNDVVAGQIALGEASSAVEAKVTISMKQGGVIQGRGANLALMASAHGDQRMDVENRRLATATRKATVGGEKGIAQGPRDITACIVRSSLFPGFPSHGPAADIETKHEMHWLSVA